jgi:GAF domain-containing protein
VVLLIGLVVVMAAFAVYLTHQQKQIVAARERLRIARQQSKERAQRHYSRLMALYSVGQVMGAENDPQKVFDCITSMCQEIFGSEQASLMLLNSRTGELEIRSAIGHVNIEEVRKARRYVGEGIAGWVAQHRKPVLLGPATSLDRYPGLSFMPRPLSSAMVVPLEVRDEIAGVLSVSNRTATIRYTAEDLAALLIFAESAEASIRHTEQTDWMRQTIHNLHGLSEGNRGIRDGDRGLLREPGDLVGQAPSGNGNGQGGRCS